ncbi:endolytic transglycosylase MltG [Nocardia otitidiscaviarum]|uniref:endolytic transglycosylase MltG n=1 Tax=Nocardia otitidiscaviarum TaxID=1823 RepID=UPI001894A7D9|nr:endolytic transglycosylase MltG [Nocardia otitidiscaviarum]MBF6237311.1 endolytic transglycosylase MltG [Nocardia otitidiscaviarum]
MTDRWTRAEERYRQDAERRYRRDDLDWDEVADDYEDDTTVIPRYTDADEPPRRNTMRRAGDRSRRAETGSETGTSGRRVGARAGAAGGRSGSRSGAQRGRRSSRVASRKAAERKRRRRNIWIFTFVFAVLFAGAAGFALLKVMNRYTPPEDFAGPAGPVAVVRVQPGETASEIAETMYDKGVVASTAAFYEAAVKNDGMNSLQPGYYAIPTHSPAADAVAALVGNSSRVGNVVLSEGRQLHDSTDVHTGARKDGIYRKIADASCVSGKCVSYEQLEAAGASDPVALGVPEWALERVRTVPDRSRQLEGLIAAGTLDFDPSGTPEQILKQLVSESAARYEETGLLQSGGANGLTPYETLVAASLVEREALPNDMSKVARVIVNRLEVGQPLQFDSTVNYTLDKTEVATTDADRARETPWNTYAMSGLPATPISAPSLDALRAMENPEPGPWLYFVTIDKQGTTLFTESYGEHLRNITKAQESGILDSGR